MTRMSVQDSFAAKQLSSLIMKDRSFPMQTMESRLNDRTKDTYLTVQSDVIKSLKVASTTKERENQSVWNNYGAESHPLRLHNIRKNGIASLNPTYDKSMRPVRLAKVAK